MNLLGKIKVIASERLIYRSTEGGRQGDSACEGGTK